METLVPRHQCGGKVIRIAAARAVGHLSRDRRGVPAVRIAGDGGRGGAAGEVGAGLGPSDSAGEPMVGPLTFAEEREAAAVATDEDISRLRVKATNARLEANARAR